MTVIVAKEPSAVDTTVRIPESHVIVLFGATGDLARRKLLPGIFHLSTAGLMPQHFRIVGTSRREFSDDDFRGLARASGAMARRIRHPVAWSPDGPRKRLRCATRRERVRVALACIFVINI